jgi:tetratricopeptide (TPR) repeat protein
VPYVPLASEIARDCRQIASQRGRGDEPTGKSQMEIYAHWLQRAFPDRGLRQDYFRKWIANKPISHTNLRLAHLLSEKKLATLVVTPNFDNFLTRALNLFGQEHIVCDHPATTERINPESTDVQIVHVHGTYWFYDLCNLPSEIKGRSVDTPLHSVTMSSLLDDILRRHSAIVIGYSGWEGDVITTALRRRHTSTVPHNLYWFCYSRGDAESVPQCVRDSLDACLVLPPARSVPRVEATPVTELKTPAVSNELDPTLPAQLVLDKLVGAFTVRAPYLTQDPIGFFGGELLKCFPQEVSEKPGDDIYDLRGVIRTVQSIQRSSKKKKPAALESEIERVSDAVRRSAYPEALKRMARLERKVSSAKQRRMLMESAFAASAGLGDNSITELKGYDLVVRLATGKVADRTPARRLVAQALFNKGLTLGQLSRREEAITAYDAILERFGKANDAVLHKVVARAYVNKGNALGQLGRREEQISTYDKISERFGDTTEPELRAQVAWSLYGKGYALSQLERTEEAISTYDEVLKRFGDTAEPAQLECAMRALVNKGVGLSKLGLKDEAIATYDEVVERFGNATETAFREGTAKALINRCWVLKELNRIDQAGLAFREALRRLDGASEEQLLSCLNKAQRGLRSLDDSVPPTP